MPGTPVGNPIAACVGSTSSGCHFGFFPSLWSSRSPPLRSSSSSSRSPSRPSLALIGFNVGHWLGGGGVSLVTQSRRATRTRFTSPVDGTGLALNVPLPQLLPGHTTAPGDSGFCVVVPCPPPWVEL